MTAHHAEARAGFKPFTRVIPTPPAWPWQQTRVAQLEAQHTSPVSGDDITIIVKRLAPWALGQGGKFVAIYVRGIEAQRGLNFTLDIQGKSLVIDIPSPEMRAAQSQARLWRIGCGAVVVIGVVCLTLLALQRRAAEEARLAEMELKIERQWREARGILRAKQDAQSLGGLQLDDRTLDKTIADLSFVTSARDTSVRLETFYWNQGYWGVETRGEASPLKSANVPLERSVKPVRKGVWLWVATQPEGQP